MSRNSPETGIRVFNNIRNKEIDITRHAFTGGESVVDYLEAIDVDLFLTTNVSDAQKIIDAHICAAAIVKKLPTEQEEPNNYQVRFIFDGDAVLFNESSEIVYKTKGLDHFQESENEKLHTPMAEGPYAALLKNLSRLQERLPFSIEFSPVRIAIVTARSAPAEMRVVNILRHWGVYIDQVFFMGGLDKKKS